MTSRVTPHLVDPAGAQLQRHAGPVRRILVVDPDHDLRRLYTEALAHPGYEVDVAADGADGWRALQARNYHLLITEHELPKLSGMELVKNLRSARMDVPVVLAAASFPTWDLAQDPSLQLAAMLLKPFDINTLLSTVEIALHAAARTRL